MSSDEESGYVRPDAAKDGYASPSPATVIPQESWFSRAKRYVAAQDRKTIAKFVATVVFVILLFVGVFLAVKFGLVLAFLEWVRSLGNWGRLVMVGALMVASLPIPFIFGLLTVSSGLMFGVWIGLLCTMVGGGIGAVLVFLLSRFVFRERVERYMETNAFYVRFSGRFEQEGWKLALAMRLASVPFGLLNVFLAITKLKLPMFALTTIIGELPIAFIGAFIGSSLGSLSEAAGAGGHTEWTGKRIALFVVEGLVAVTFVVIAVLLSKKMIKDSMQEEEAAKAKNDSDSENETELSGTYEMDPIEIISTSENDPSQQDVTATTTVVMSPAVVDVTKSPSEEKLRLRRSKEKKPRDENHDFGVL